MSLGNSPGDSYMLFFTNNHAFFTCGERKICSIIKKFQNIINMTGGGTYSFTVKIHTFK